MLSGRGLTASSQAPYPSSRRKRQDSLTSLLLLFPRHPLRWAAVGALFPPFSGPASLQQVLVPILALGGGAGGYGVTFFCVLRLELLCSFPPWPVRVQAKNDPLQMWILPQVGVQRALVEAAQGHGVAPHLPVQGAEAHKVDGSLEHRHPIQGRVAGEPEGHAFVAAHRVSLEAGAVQVVGTALAGEHRLAAAVPAHEHAVVMKAILVQKASFDEAPDDLGGDASLLKIGKHPPLIRMGDG